MRARLLIVAMTVPIMSAAAAPPPFFPPETPARPVVDVLHGTTLTDRYRWLENGRDPEVEAWTRAQHAATVRNVAPFQANVTVPVAPDGATVAVSVVLPPYVKLVGLAVSAVADAALTVTTSAREPFVLRWCSRSRPWGLSTFTDASSRRTSSCSPGRSVLSRVPKSPKADSPGEARLIVIGAASEPSVSTLPPWANELTQ